MIVGGPTTVMAAALLVAPGPVSFALTGPVMFVSTAAAMPVTVTLIVQLPPAAIVPPASLMVFPPVVVSVPPPQVAELPLATVRPAGKLSVNATPVMGSDAFVLVIVKVRVVDPFNGIVAAPKALLIVGGVATVRIAVLLVMPVPPLVELTAPVVLFLTPGVMPVTTRLNVQLLPPAIDAPASVIKLPPLVLSVPPQVSDVPLVTVNPAGSVSLNATPLSGTVAFGFVIVKLRVVVPFSGIFAAPNALEMVGGATTVIVAVLLVPPVPPLVALTAPVVLFLTPAVVPVTVTLNEQLVLLPIDPPASDIMFGAVVVRVPPPHTVELPFGTVKPNGSVSVNCTPVNDVVVFGFVMVNVSTLVPFNGIVAASNDFIIDGGPTTVSIAVLLVPPAPLSLELMFPVVLLQTPVVEPVTVTLNEQVPLAPSVPPEKVMVLGEVVETMPPPQAAVGPEVGTVIPAGSESMNAMPVSPRVVLGFVMLNVRVLVWPSRMLEGENDFMIVGAAATLIETVAVLVQPPGLLSTYLNVSRPWKAANGV
jgi:hypothetical protein